jgi:putative transposase
VFSTTNRKKLIADHIRPKLWAYMGGIARENNMVAYAIGGTDDHAHVLISIPPSISAAKAIQLLKGASSKWVNDEFPMNEHFSWQQGYAAFSLSPSRMKKTIEYINNQEDHHKKVPFKDEYLEFLKGHSVEYDERYVLG